MGRRLVVVMLMVGVLALLVAGVGCSKARKPQAEPPPTVTPSSVGPTAATGASEPAALPKSNPAVPTTPSGTVKPVPGHTVHRPRLPEPEPKVKTVKMKWAASYEAGVEESKSSGKPLMTYIFDSRDAALREMDTQVFANPAVAKLAQNFVCARLDLKTGRDTAKVLAEKHGISQRPAVLFTRPDGSKLELRQGLADASAMLEIMNQALAKAKKGR